MKCLRFVLVLLCSRHVYQNRVMQVPFYGPPFLFRTRFLEYENVFGLRRRERIEVQAILKTSKKRGVCVECGVWRVVYCVLCCVSCVLCGVLRVCCLGPSAGGASLWCAVFAPPPQAL